MGGSSLDSMASRSTKGMKGGRESGKNVPKGPVWIGMVALYLFEVCLVYQLPLAQYHMALLGHVLRLAFNRGKFLPCEL